MGDMDFVSIRFDLDGDEAAALRRLASKELRTPRAQAVILVLRGLARLGLLALQEPECGLDQEGIDVTDV